MRTDANTVVGGRPTRACVAQRPTTLSDCFLGIDSVVGVGAWFRVGEPDEADGRNELARSPRGLRERESERERERERAMCFSNTTSKSSGRTLSFRGAQNSCALLPPKVFVMCVFCLVSLVSRVCSGLSSNTLASVPRYSSRCPVAWEKTIDRLGSYAQSRSTLVRPTRNRQTGVATCGRKTRIPTARKRKGESGRVLFCV